MHYKPGEDQPRAEICGSNGGSISGGNRDQARCLRLLGGEWRWRRFEQNDLEGDAGGARRPFASDRIRFMANLTLVYGMRLLPSEEVSEVGDATLKLKNGREAHVTMHVLEGSKEEIEKQLKTSLEAFFDFYPEI